MLMNQCRSSLMNLSIAITAWKVSKYGVISGPYFPLFGVNTEIYVFSPNTGEYGSERTSYLGTFHAVNYCSFKDGQVSWEVNSVQQNLSVELKLLLRKFLNPRTHPDLLCA